MIPVTILCGALGSGKTTLLRKLLRNSLGIRIAVIENEFGDEKGIERLVALGNNDKNPNEEATITISNDLFVELSNGCVCCGVKDSLVQTLETLIAKKSRFDHIVIETSGMADPGPVAAIFWSDSELESSLMLNGIVSMVDLKNFELNLSNVPNESRHQIAYADRVVLNKYDLLQDENALQKIKQTVKCINRMAAMETCSFGDLDLNFVLQICTLDKSQLVKNVFTLSLEHVHDNLVSSLVFRKSDSGISLQKLKEWLGAVLWEPPHGLQVFRIKGIVWSKDDFQRVYIAQSVHGVFEIEAWDDWDSLLQEQYQQRETKLVIIGRGVVQYKNWLLDGLGKM